MTNGLSSAGKLSVVREDDLSPPMDIKAGQDEVALSSSYKSCTTVSPTHGHLSHVQLGCSFDFTMMMYNDLFFTLFLQTND